MPTPVLQALLLCDHVYVDKWTGKKILAGVFNKLYAEDFPSQLAQTTYAFVSIREVQGEVPLSLRYVQLNQNKVLMSIDLTVRCHDPLETVDMPIELPGFPMPEPGFYVFQLLHEEIELGSVRLLVEKQESIKAD